MITDTTTPVQLLQDQRDRAQRLAYDLNESSRITRAAVSVAADTLRDLAAELERIDRADTCQAAGRIRAVLRTLAVANEKEMSARADAFFRA